MKIEKEINLKIDNLNTINDLLNYEKLKPELNEIYNDLNEDNKKIFTKIYNLFKHDHHIESNKLIDTIKYETKSEEALIYYFKSINYFFLNQYHESLEHLNKALDIKINFTEAFNLRGICLFNLKKYGEALVSYKNGLKIINSPVILTNIGNIYLQENNMTKAIEYYKKAIDIDNNYDNSYYNLANLYFNIKKFRLSTKYYKKAIKLDKSNTFYWNNLGNTFFMRNMLKRAFNCYNKALNLDFNYELPWNNLGNIYLVRRKYSDAINCYKRSILINPNFLFPSLNLNYTRNQIQKNYFKNRNNIFYFLFHKQLHSLYKLGKNIYLHLHGLYDIYKTGSINVAYLKSSELEIWSNPKATNHVSLIINNKKIIGLLKKRDNKNSFLLDLDGDGILDTESDTFILPFWILNYYTKKSSNKKVFEYFKRIYDVFNVNQSPYSNPIMKKSLESLISIFNTEQEDNRDLFYCLFYYSNFKQKLSDFGIEALLYIYQECINRFNLVPPIILLYLLESYINLGLIKNAKEMLKKLLDYNSKFIPARVYEYQLEENIDIKRSLYNSLKDQYPKHWIVKQLNFSQ